MIEEHKLKLEWWKLIIGSLVAIIVVLVPLVWKTLDSNSEAPEFILASPVLSADSILDVYSRNDAANKKGDIHVEWDGFLFHFGAKEAKRLDIKYSWSFSPKMLLKNEKLISAGEHKVRFGFNNQGLSDFLLVSILDQDKINNLKKELSTTEVKNSNKGLPRLETNLPDTPAKKSALVIGNANYANALRPLNSSINDSKIIAEKLEKIGFDVTLGIDLTLSDFKTILFEFSKKQGKNDISVIYYTGHGISLGGYDYILPIDTVILDARDIDKYGVPLKKLTSIIDELENQIILYSSSPGQLALDNGFFADSLANYLAEPNLEVSSVFRKVTNEVKEKTNKRQVPWLYSSANENIVLSENPTEKSKSLSTGIVIIDSSRSAIYGSK